MRDVTGRPIVRSTAATPSVSVTSPALTVAESSASVTVSVTLTTPGGGATACPVTAAYHTTPGTAASGADYGERSGTVVFRRQLGRCDANDRHPDPAGHDADSQFASRSIECDDEGLTHKVEVPEA